MQTPSPLIAAAAGLSSRRLTAADFEQEVLILFDAYVHGDLDRRGFLDRAAKFAKGGVTAAAMLAALQPDFVMGQVVPKNDARLKTEMVTIKSPDGYGEIKAYVAKPASAAANAKLPSLLVVHENRGLNPHIEDITRRLALDGYLVMAPDALTSQGGYPGDEDKARTMFGTLDQILIRKDFLASYAALKSRADSNGRVGVTGFCYGGGMAHYLATQLPDLLASVPFYGNHPPVEDAAKVKAPLQIHFAAIDERINAGWPPYEAALKAAGARYEAHTYPGTQHGFNNDTTARFDKDAAALAWSRTQAFFARHVKG